MTVGDGSSWAGQSGADGYSAPTYSDAAARSGQPGTPPSASPQDGPRSDPRGGPDPHGSSGEPEFGQVIGRPTGAGRRRGRAGRRTSPRVSVRPVSTGNVTVTRAVLARSSYLSRLVTHKVISASQADGARESGLTALIWNQVMSYASDAMVTVALAGTVFFSAPSEAQRGNVLLYLLMTMAPFALVAPVIGPALDRVQHGRRWVMAGTALGRAVLAIVMAMHFTDLLLLFPAA
ncbi:MAG: MFS transporter, partial [Jatrophihabitantaceae bacterium]